jgi:hypothetical protein
VRWYLHNHLLTSNGGAGEGELVAGTAPRRLRSTGNVDGSVTIGKVVGDGVWRLVGAHVGRSSITSVDGVGVGKRRVFHIAGTNWAGAGGKSSLTTPGTRRLAAIPVTGGFTRARCLSIGLEEEREESEKNGGWELHLD